MFPGNLPLVNLVDQKAINYRKHRFWWIVGLVFLALILIGQRYAQAFWYKEDIDALNAQRDYQQQRAQQLQAGVDALPETLVQQHQNRHIKLSVLLRLMQKYQSADTQINSISWSNKLRIEGQAQSRSSISLLQSSLVESGYFDDISLEQLRQQQQLYSFSLIVSFAGDVHFSLLAEHLSR